MNIFDNMAFPLREHRRKSHPRRRRRGLRPVDAVREAAGTFGEALAPTTPRPGRAPRRRARAVHRAFQEEQADAFDTGLAEVITEVEAVATGIAEDVDVTELGDDDAQAIVVLDVEVDGARKADQVTGLNLDPGAGTSTTTGAPESTTTSI